MADCRVWCSVCDGTSFNNQHVVSDALAAEWQLTSAEREHMDRRNGTTCSGCGCDLSSIALSDAIRAAVETETTLRGFAYTPAADRLSVLQINGSGDLAPFPRKSPGHVLATLRDVDMQALPYASDSFDLVVHSDVLEHVSQPLLALAECLRVLREGGILCFTIPVVVGRLSRGRAGLPLSYHGGASGGEDAYPVRTEFGVDAWTYLIQAGFEAVRVNVVDFPSAMAISARKPAAANSGKAFRRFVMQTSRNVWSLIREQAVRYLKVS